MRIIALTLALSLAAAGGAFAQPGASTSLTLANGASAPGKVIIDGAVWKCADGACVASGGKSQTADRACRRVVARLGAVSAFRWQGETLSEEAVTACNVAAR
ncbi:MAG: hypothetical protein K1X35_04165 [Caulobacteraceae bacterium]|nr:hypothetical protein [Caulobacteraceae bacterium]